MILKLLQRSCALAGLTAAALPAAAATLEIDTSDPRHVAIGDDHTAVWYRGVLDTHDLEGQAARSARIYNTFGSRWGEEVRPQEFWVAPPEGYDPTAVDGPKVPLIIYLHGSGARGESGVHLDIEPLRYWSRPDVQAAAPGGNGAMIVAPHIRNTHHRWVEVGTGNNDYNVPGYEADETPVGMAMRLALTAIAGLTSGGTDNFATRIDPSRIYIVGQSMGGFGTWDAIARISQATGTSELEQWLMDEHAAGGELWSSFNLAAAITAAGAGPIDRGLEMAELPIWALAHMEDELVPGEGTLNVLQSIRDALNDPDAVYQTSSVTRDAGIDETLAELLAYKHLFTEFQGEVPERFRNAHSWVTNGTMTAGDLRMAQWLFAQSVPTPASAALMLLGATALLWQRRSRQDRRSAQSLCAERAAT